jgi:hypothetical protein
MNLRSCEEDWPDALGVDGTLFVRFRSHSTCLARSDLLEGLRILKAGKIDARYDALLTLIVAPRSWALFRDRDANWLDPVNRATS